MTNDVVFMPVRQLSELVIAREVSPVELAEVFLQRLETLGPKYNAVVTVTRERAMEEACVAEQEIASGNYKGALHGIPYGAKDLLATSGGIPTTWGASPFRHQTFDYDATVIRKLREAGAVLVAKLAMVELAGGMEYHQPNASFTGPGVNPWDHGTWSGGSSSGSGSAVSAGLVPFAIGSDTWGSILGPAHYCGIAGLRPTYGRVSRYGAMPLSWTLDKLGPMCLTAEDCELVLAAIAGPDPDDPTAARRLYRYERVSGSSDSGFKIGVLRGTLEGVQEVVRVNFEGALGVLAGSATIEDVEFPDLPYGAVTKTILSAEVAASFDEFIEGGGPAGLTAPESRVMPYAQTAVLAKEYLRALRIRGVMSRAVDEVLSDYDAVVAPTSDEVAPPIDQEFRDIGDDLVGDVVGAISNGTGFPSISVPNGFSEAGLPTGIQFMGRAYDENVIIAAAQAYQSLTDWHQRHPPDLSTGD